VRGLFAFGQAGCGWKVGGYTVAFEKREGTCGEPLG
jgi:hypothetical protein